MTHAFIMESVVKKYRGFQLGPVDFILDPGTVIGLIGPNGSGKTTTINILVGLVRHDAGSIHVYGKLTNPNDPSWKFDIGYVGDSHVFYEYWSGRRNLDFMKQFYPAWSDEKVDELADRFQIDLKKRANSLSKGNRAKLSLIGALAHSPKLLILDEPTSGLDPVVRIEFLDALWESMEKGDTAVLYSTHILSDISRIADELVFLNEGKIISRTKKDDLIDKWRRISFKWDGSIDGVCGVVSVRQEGNSHLIISSGYIETVRELTAIGITDIETSVMGIDEIAVEILKGGGDVEAG